MSSFNDEFIITSYDFFCHQKDSNLLLKYHPHSFKIYIFKSQIQTNNIIIWSYTVSDLTNKPMQNSNATYINHAPIHATVTENNKALHGIIFHINMYIKFTLLSVKRFESFKVSHMPEWEERSAERVIDLTSERFADRFRREFSREPSRTCERTRANTRVCVLQIKWLLIPGLGRLRRTRARRLGRKARIKWRLCLLKKIRAGRGDVLFCRCFLFYLFALERGAVKKCRVKNKVKNNFSPAKIPAARNFRAIFRAHADNKSGESEALHATDENKNPPGEWRKA